MRLPEIPFFGRNRPIHVHNPSLELLAASGIDIPAAANMPGGKVEELIIRPPSRVLARMSDGDRRYTLDFRRLSWGPIQRTLYINGGESEQFIDPFFDMDKLTQAVLNERTTGNNSPGALSKITSKFNLFRRWWH